MDHAQYIGFEEKIVHDNLPIYLFSHLSTSKNGDWKLLKWAEVGNAATQAELFWSELMCLTSLLFGKKDQKWDCLLWWRWTWGAVVQGLPGGGREFLPNCKRLFLPSSFSSSFIRMDIQKNRWLKEACKNRSHDLPATWRMYGERVVTPHGGLDNDLRGRVAYSWDTSEHWFLRSPRFPTHPSFSPTAKHRSWAQSLFSPPATLPAETISSSFMTLNTIYMLMIHRFMSLALNSLFNTSIYIYLPTW